MAKSRLIGGRKNSTILVSSQTVKDAIRRANNLASTWMNSDPNDPRLDEVQRIVTNLSSVLKKTPQQMRADGVTSVEDYFDDAKSQQAQTIRREVNMIAKMHDEQRGQSAQPAKPTPVERGVSYVPDHAIASVKEANGGGAAFSTDRDEQGEAKAPELATVPRLAKKKKKEAEEPAPVAPVAPPTDQVPEVAPVAPPAAAPAAAPAPAGSGAVNPIDYIPTETLIKVIGDIQKQDDFAQNRGKQDALINLTEIIKSRPIEPVEQEAAPAPAAGAPALPIAASKKADYGDHAVGGNGTIGDAPASPSVSVGAGNNISTSAGTSAGPKSDTSNSVDLGGLSIASALEEDKTADDYRIHDYKLEGEGVVPTGQLPNADEQANQMQPEPDGTFEKESVTPPGISEEQMHGLKSQYPGEPDKAYATAWKIHNQSSKLAKFITEQVMKIASGAAGGGWFFDINEKGQITEDGGRTPEVAEAHGMLDESPAKLDRPATTAPIKLNKQAAEMTCGKAVKQSEQLGNDLKKMYLEAKSLTQVNDTRVVREAVEAIFRAGDMMDGALKALGKQHEQEENEAAAQEIKAKNKKSSSFQGLALAAAE